MTQRAEFIAAPAVDPVRIALRHRTRRRVLIALALLLAAGTAALSHVRAGPDSSQWDGKTVTVDQVLPGGTLLIARRDAAPLKVMLRAVDTNGFEAADRYLTARLTGKAVVLKCDGTANGDADRRLAAYVYLGDSDCLNVDLVRDGMAYFDRRSRSFLQSTLDPIETSARTRKIGLWKDLRFADMPAWRQEWVRERAEQKKPQPGGKIVSPP